MIVSLLHFPVRTFVCDFAHVPAISPTRQEHLCENRRMEDQEKFLSTPEGLVFAKSFAEKLQMEFDEGATRKEADEILELHFGAIMRVTRLPTDLAVFDAAAYRNLNAFVPISAEENGNIVFRRTA